MVAVVRNIVRWMASLREDQISFTINSGKIERLLLRASKSYLGLFDSLERFNCGFPFRYDL